MRNIKIGLLAFFIAVGGIFSLSLLPAPQATAQDCFGQKATMDTCLNAGACLDTQGATSNKNCPSEVSATRSVNDTIKLVINILSLVVGIVAVIMIIIGGLKYITSGGDSGNVSSAKNTILYAIIGLVIVALAQIIVRFVIDRATVEPTTTETTSIVDQNAQA